MKKILLFEKAVETLSYFSRQIAASPAFADSDTFFFDMKKKASERKRVERLFGGGDGTLLTFNFIGMDDEPELQTECGSLWEQYDMQILCILVDHPLYYHRNLMRPRKHFHLFCVDRDHVDYVRRFYPWIEVDFLPLAGNLLPEKAFPFGNFEAWCHSRDEEISFIANYVPLQRLEAHIGRMNSEYAAFYRNAIDALCSHPRQSLFGVLSECLKREIPELSETELAEGMSAMVLADLYVRSVYREKTVCILADAGIPVRLYGKDWELSRVRDNKYAKKSDGMCSSEACAQALRKSRLALNTMPWFKDGAHDRIFTAMLQGAVSLTDDSCYLREILQDESDVLFYDLEKLEELPEIVLKAEKNQERLYEIAKSGYALACKNHTWANRAQILRMYI